MHKNLTILAGLLAVACGEADHETAGPAVFHEVTLTETQQEPFVAPITARFFSCDADEACEEVKMHYVAGEWCAFLDGTACLDDGITPNGPQVFTGYEVRVIWVEPQ